MLPEFTVQFWNRVNISMCDVDGKLKIKGRRDEEEKEDKDILTCIVACQGMSSIGMT